MCMRTEHFVVLQIEALFVAVYHIVTARGVEFADDWSSLQILVAAVLQ